MQTITISLDTVQKVKGFVNTISPLDGDFDLISERYVVDAKSIMGIFSLDLGKPLTLKLHDEASAADIIEKLKPYIV